VFVLVCTLWPFHVRLEPAHLVEKLGEIEWEPLYGAVSGREHPGHASPLRDMVQNVVLFAPLGALWKYGRPEPEPSVRERAKWLGQAVLAAFALSVLVEALQLFTEDRVSQLGDVVFDALGGLLGAAGLLLMRARSRRA
jgi:glycopeptide antibiotics resistance protein